MWKGLMAVQKVPCPYSLRHVIKRRRGRTSTSVDPRRIARGAAGCRRGAAARAAPGVVESAAAGAAAIGAATVGPAAARAAPVRGGRPRGGLAALLADDEPAQRVAQRAVGHDPAQVDAHVYDRLGDALVDAG